MNNDYDLYRIKTAQKEVHLRINTTSEIRLSQAKTASEVLSPQN